MPLLTPALTRSQTLLRRLGAHLATDPCPAFPRPENRLQSLAIRNAHATTTDIDELHHHARIIAEQTISDLAITYHLLAAHTDCHSCRTLRRDAGRLHLDLGDEI